jgi:hypothetical protein
MSTNPTHPSQPGEQQKELRAGINRAALSVMRRNPNWQNPTHKELHLLAVPFEDWPGSAQSDCVMLADFAEQQVLLSHAQSQARIEQLESRLRFQSALAEQRLSAGIENIARIVALETALRKIDGEIPDDPRLPLSLAIRDIARLALNPPPQ